MRYSKVFIPTTKEAPKDATLESHKLLIRAGFIDQLGSGLYNYLPLGMMVLNRIKNIVKEEMDRSGSNEVLFSFVTPSEFWGESGRLEAYGKELLRLKDRKENSFVLSPTNEESAVNAVKNRITSYKQLPLSIYQINTKFRDEARPRFGLLRGREFIMKDAYSFHSSLESLDDEFENMFKTYSKIFTRLGLNFRAVEADSGAIGGSGSKEFMVISDRGEDDILVCQNCSYAANAEAAKREPKTAEADTPEFNMSSKFHTPNLKTIDEVAEFFKVDKFYTIKAIIKKAHFRDRSEIVVFFVRGCDDLEETKALNACGALELSEASADEIEKAGLKAGFVGPAKLPQSLNFYIDAELKDARNLICGSNEIDYHTIGFSVINFKDERFKDLVAVKDGDRCVECGGVLKGTKGIEVGHIFKLGTKYSAAMGANFLDENGKAKPFIMGCYGIGVSRLLAVMAEVSHDERGIIWDRSVAAFELTIIVSSVKDEDQMSFASEIYSWALSKNIRVLLDDRDVRFGVKMSEFELIGHPYAVVVGRGLKNGEVEVIKRKTLEKSTIKKDEILEKLEAIFK